MSTCKWKKSLPIQVSENMTFVDQRGVTWKDAELTLLKNDLSQPWNETENCAHDELNIASEKNYDGK